MRTNLDVPQLVHFFGPDGAGKTVQAAILVDLLNHQGLRARKFWLRAHHTLAFIMWKVFLKIGFYRITYNSTGEERKIPAIDRGKLMREFWSLIELVSILPHVLRLHLFLSRGYCIIADRYLLDTIVAIAYVTNDLDFLTSRISRTICRFIPERTAFIYLDSDYETILRRRLSSSVTASCTDKREHFQNDSRKSYVEPRSFIDFQRTAYAILANSVEALVINTSRTSIEETSKIIRQYLSLV